MSASKRTFAPHTFRAGVFRPITLAGSGPVSAGRGVGVGGRNRIAALVASSELSRSLEDEVSRLRVEELRLRVERNKIAYEVLIAEQQRRLLEIQVYSILLSEL